MRKIKILVVLAIMLSVNAFSQSVGINSDGSEPDGRTILDVKSTDKGVLLPRLSDAERDALGQNIPNGMIIINTTAKQMQIFFDNGWYPLSMGTVIPAPTAPTATTNAATSVAQNTATLSGTVNANNAETTVTFEYGLTTGYGSEVTANESPVSGETNTSVSAFISSLTEDTTYHYRVKAVNAVGTTYGNDQTLQSAPVGITDGDGNVYTSVVIGTQEWLVQNLKTTKYNDGTPIPNVTDNATWVGLTTPAYAWYNNDYANYGSVYGALYNWYVVDSTSNGGKNVCPVGWHVPVDVKWSTLTFYLGGENVAGGKMKETGTTHWNSPNTEATNASGFTALPGGIRDKFDGSFYYTGHYGYWWCSTAYSTYDSGRHYLYYKGAYVNHFYDGKQYGFSVRCLKDN